MTRLLLILRSADNSRFGFLLFFFSTFLVAAFELISVAGVPIFFTVLLTPDVALQYISKYLPWLHAETIDHVTLVVTIGGMLTIFLLLKGVMALTISMYQARAMAKYQAKLSSQLLSRYLEWPYEKHLTKNSAVLLRNTVSIPVTIVSSIFVGITTLATEALVVILMASVLVLYHPVITVLTVATLGVVIGLFFLLLKNRLAKAGQCANAAAAKTMQWLNQSFGGLKEIRTANREQYFHNQYLKHFTEFSKATYKAQYLAQAPRFFLEFIAISGMVGLAVALLMIENKNEILPTIALFGAVSLRLIPSANRIWGALAVMRANIDSVEIFERDMAEKFEEPPVPVSSSGLKFDETLELKDLSYSYPESDLPALDNISFKICSNTTVGIAGRSGAGKSTLLDILLGLHRANAGKVLVDGQSIWEILPAWRAAIGYVPQQIFILDDSIRRNIALGDEDHVIDDERIMKALEKASLYEFVQALTQGFDTVLGEGGARLSGGQRQRIGIARALYRDPKVLFLDEATSALDNETERAVTETLQRLHGTMTIVIVAHHAEVMRLCDHVFMLDKGRLVANGSASELEGYAIQFK